MHKIACKADGGIKKFKFYFCDKGTILLDTFGFRSPLVDVFLIFFSSFHSFFLLLLHNRIAALASLWSKKILSLHLLDEVRSKKKSVLKIHFTNTMNNENREWFGGKWKFISALTSTSNQTDLLYIGLDRVECILNAFLNQISKSISFLSL